MDTQSVWRQLQFSLDDLMWDARVHHESLQQTYAHFEQLSEDYLNRAEAADLPRVKQLLDDFQAKLDSGAVTAFVEKVA